MFWWIDTFTIKHGHYYRYHVHGYNDFAAECLALGRPGMPPDFSWSIPALIGPYAFRLRVVA